MGKRGLNSLIAILALVSLLLVLTPWWLGGRIQNNLTDSMLATAPVNLRSQLSIETLGYERGLFSSQAHYKLLYQALGMSEPLPLEFMADIQHGPILQTGQGMRLGLTAADIRPLMDLGDIEAELLELGLTLPEINIAMLAGFDQSVELLIDIASSQASTEEGSFTFAGLAANLLVQSDMSAIGAMNMGQLLASSENGNRLSIDGIEITSATAQINDMLAPSTATLTIPAISASGSSNFAMENIVASSRLSESPSDSERLDMAQAISVAAIESQWQISALDWTLGINRVPKSLLRTYSELMLEVQSQINNQTSANNAAQLGQDLGLQLLRTDFQIASHLDIDMFGGNNLLNTEFDYTGLPKLNNLGNLSMDALLTALDFTLDADFDLEAVLASPIANLIDPYVQEGYIIIENGRVLANASFRDGEFQLNGSTMAIEELF